MKRSLHIGINDYPGTDMDLAGCVNDADDWRAALEARNFEATSMLDGDATKSNIIEALNKITRDSGRDDIAVITYSGHGTWVPDMDGDESDGRDEALCPYDVTLGNIVTDDELYDIFSDRKRGARIIVISDSCHSGTLTRATRSLPENEMGAKAAQKARFLSPVFYIRDDEEMLRKARQAESLKASGKIRAAAVLISGCRDEEYSYDARFNNRPNGAFTYASLQALKEVPATASYRKWHQQIREYLPSINYPQTPQLSGSWTQRNKWRILCE